MIHPIHLWIKEGLAPLIPVLEEILPGGLDVLLTDLIFPTPSQDTAVALYHPMPPLSQAHLLDQVQRFYLFVVLNIFTNPKFFLAILGKELPEKSDTSDRNSDTFWERTSKLQHLNGKTQRKIRHSLSKKSQLPDTSKKKSFWDHRYMILFYTALKIVRYDSFSNFHEVDGSSLLLTFSKTICTIFFVDFYQERSFFGFLVEIKNISLKSL